MTDTTALQSLADKVEVAARAICQEQCAMYGEPACWRIAPDKWPNIGCAAPGCHALAKAAVAALIAKEGGPE